MRIDLLARLFFIALTLVMARDAAAENEADCDDVTIRFDVGGGEPYCYAGKSKGRDGGGGPIGWSVDWQFMAAEEDFISRAVEVAIGNRWSYIEVATVMARMEEGGWFTSLSSWGEPYELGGYEVARFFALWNGINASWQCAGFIRYAVPAEHGYREALNGFICAAPHVQLEDDAASLPREYQLLTPRKEFGGEPFKRSPWRKPPEVAPHGPAATLACDRRVL